MIRLFLHLFIQKKNKPSFKIFLKNCISNNKLFSFYEVISPYCSLIHMLFIKSYFNALFMKCNIQSNIGETYAF